MDEIETPKMYRVVAKRGSYTVVDSVIRREDLRQVLRLLHDELLDVTATPMDEESIKED